MTEPFGAPRPGADEYVPPASASDYLEGTPATFIDEYRQMTQAERLGHSLNLGRELLVEAIERERSGTPDHQTNVAALGYLLFAAHKDHTSTPDDEPLDETSWQSREAVTLFAIAGALFLPERGVASTFREVRQLGRHAFHAAEIQSGDLAGSGDTVALFHERRLLRARAAAAVAISMLRTTKPVVEAAQPQQPHKPGLRRRFALKLAQTTVPNL